MSMVKDLTPLFRPRSVAVIGASSSPSKISHCCLESLLEGGFGHRIYPVSPRASEILGLTVYPSLAGVPHDVDMAVVAVAADLVPTVLEDCARKNIRAAVIITSGFKELGTEWGAKLQNDIVAIANGAGINIIGPNTMGVVSPHQHLNATFLPSFKHVAPGNIALITQSGGVCSFLLHSAINENVGISLAASLGNRANVDFAHVVEYLGDHPQTHAIALHIEGVDNPRLLADSAKRLVGKKPVVAYKPWGPTPEKAAFSHTGSVAGRHEAYEAAFSQAGMVAVQDTTELMDVAKALAFQPPARGNRVAVLSLQAGPGMIAASACHRCGLALADPSRGVKNSLAGLAVTPSFSYNPIDLAGAFTQSGTDHSVWLGILELALGDECVDAVLLSALYHRLDRPFIESVADLARDRGLRKPLVVCRDSPLGAARPEIAMLEENGIPVYPTPDRAVRAIAGLARYGRAVDRMG
jgi:acyl-CoA synthetase (NDP forming)